MAVPDDAAVAGGVASADVAGAFLQSPLKVCFNGLKTASCGFQQRLHRGSRGRGVVTGGGTGGTGGWLAIER